MLLDGTDAAYLVWGYSPRTKPSIQWIQKANGNWSGSDRGTSYDIFESDVVFKGPESELSDLESWFGTARGTNLTATFSTGEEIFGADINHGIFVPDSATFIAVDYGKIQKVSFGQYTFPVRFRVDYVAKAAQASFFTGSAAISSLRLTGYTYQAGSEFDYTHKFYKITQPNTSGVLFDQASDPGIFVGNFTQTHAEMKAIRRYLLTTARANTLSSFDFSAFGVSEPFGQRMGTGPFNVKIIDWKDTGRKNLIDWGLQITFARVQTVTVPAPPD